MKKQYRYGKCESFRPIQGRDAHRAIFIFSEIQADKANSTAGPIKVTLEISGTIIQDWKNKLTSTNSNYRPCADDRLKKVLCQIAIDNGLKKGEHSIKVYSTQHLSGIFGLPECSVQEGQTFSIDESQDTPFGFHPKT